MQNAEQSPYATTKVLKELPITLPALNKNELHSMHLYVIECDQRNELMEHLRSHQIGASLHYPLAVHQHPAYANRIRGGDNLPVTDQFYQRNLTLPMFPELSNDAVEHIISTVQDWFRERTKWRDKRMIKLSYNHSLGGANYPFI